MEEVFRDSLVLTVVPEHPWARQGKISIEELPKQPFIHRERGSGTRMAMSRILEDHGFDPSRLMGVAEMGSTEAVRQGIKGRIGASILSREAVAEDLQQVPDSGGNRRHFFLATAILDSEEKSSDVSACYGFSGRCPDRNGTNLAYPAQKLDLGVDGDRSFTEHSVMKAQSRDEKR